MFNENTLDMFKCGLSSVNTKAHLAVRPIRMPCGHSVCKACVPLQQQQAGDSSACSCQICSYKINKTDLDCVQEEENEMIKNLVESNLLQIVNEFKAQFNATFKNLEENTNDLHERIAANIEYVKDVITTRVESIKIELDKLSDGIKVELDEAKNDLINRSKQPNVAVFEESVCNLNNSQESDVLKSIFDYNNQMKRMNESIEALKKFNHQVTIKISDSKIDKAALIGDLNYSYRNQHLITDINNRIKSTTSRSALRTIDLNAFDICVTANDNLIASNFNDSNVCLYDRNFKLIKSVNKLNNLSFKPYSVASNLTDNKVYICDHTNNRIFMVDAEFNYLAVVGSSRMGGTLNDQFDCPLGIDFAKDNLYVCDSRNKRIQKLTSNLQFSTSYSLAYLPWQIKIGTQLACVRQLLCQNLYFHDVNTFELKIKHSGHAGYISCINTYFYEYSYEKKILYCYDQDGKLHDEIQTSKFDNTEFHSWSSIALVNNQFVMTSQPAKKLIII